MKIKLAAAIIMSLLTFFSPTNARAEGADPGESLATDCQPNAVIGIYLPPSNYLQVVEQPENDPSFISHDPQQLTRYRPATSIGLLAHNDHAGALFASMQIGQEFYAVMCDGRIIRYFISTIYRLQAISPEDPWTPLYDIERGIQLTSTETFKLTYGSGDDNIIFQTCISVGKIYNWGRLMIVATPA